MINTLKQLVFVLGIFTLFHQPAHSASKRLSGPEIKATITGKTFEYGSARGGVSTIRYTSDSYSGYSTRIGPFNGKWWVKGDKYCFKNHVGAKRCMRVKDEGNGIISYGGIEFRPK